MLIERELEARVVAAIRAAIPADAPRHVVAGLWQPTAAGTLKGFEDDPSATALIEVATGLGAQETFSSAVVSHAVTVTLYVRLDRDAQGNALLAFAEPVSALFRAWMAATYQRTFDALDGDGLSVDGVGVSGSLPDIDRDEMVATVTWTLALSGYYTDAADAADE